MPENQKITRRAAVGSMAFATAAIAIEANVFANDKKRLSGTTASKLPTKRNSEETLEEFFWKNAESQEFTVVDYSWFESREGSPQASLVLKSASRVVHQTNDDARPQEGRPYGISLLFEPQSKGDLQPASYRIEHEALGKFDFLLSKTKTKSGNVFYEAILN